MTLRGDLAIISRWIIPGSRVLDLGCGDGAFLAHLRRNASVEGLGIEIDNRHVIQCVAKGLDVIQGNLDEGLSDFDTNTFDYVIMTQTLQATRAPERLLGEMLRIGREGIVTFPNFAHWSPRLQLALGGRMPVSRTLPWQWYDTPNIHLCSVRDFETLCRTNHIRVLRRQVMDVRHRRNRLMKFLPNLFGEVALYRLCREGDRLGSEVDRTRKP